MLQYSPCLRRYIRKTEIFHSLSLSIVIQTTLLHVLVSASDLRPASSQNAIYSPGSTFRRDGFRCRVVSIVIHELIHYQQQSRDTDLISESMKEGAADFIAELITGNQIDEDIKPYGDSHEQELWKKFQEDAKKIMSNHGYTTAETKSASVLPILVTTWGTKSANPSTRLRVIKQPR